MTQLRKMMLEELQRRNYSQTTVRTYLKSVQAFAEHFHTPPDRLGLEHIRSYLASPASAAPAASFKRPYPQ